ncbi:MAG: hypothetical protein QM733_18655 [Ilumatobacteraceae bacterium]
MIKRATWFAGGIVVGIAGAGMAKRKVKEVAAQASPARVARSAFGRVGEAIGEGRRAARGREVELRARYEGVEPVALADELDPEAAVLVDGELVDAGKVIVLRPSSREPRRRRRA